MNSLPLSTCTLVTLCGQRARQSRRNWLAVWALLSLLALLLLVPACANNSTTPGGDPPDGGTDPEEPPIEEEPPTDPTGPYLVLGYSLHTASPTIVIHPTLGGTPDRTSSVADAEVTVSGVVLGYDTGAGQYRGSLPAAPAAGDTVEVEITVDGEVIEASAVVPAVPTITGPAAAAHFEPGDAIELTWNLSEDPDRFSFHIRDADGMSHWPRTDDGAARSFTLPESVVDSLPDDATPITYEVLAINDGAFSGPAHEDSTLGLEARTPAGPFFTYGTVPPGESYYVEGLMMGSRFQNLKVLEVRSDVRDESQPAPGIVGNVNGVALALDPVTSRYRATLPTPIAVGDTLSLHLEGPLGEVDATGVLPGQPTVTYPVDEGTIPGDQPVTIEWLSPTDPSYFQISIEGGTHTRWSSNIPGDLRAYTFPSADIDMAVDLTIRLSAVNDGAFEGQFEAGSSMGITNHAPEVTFLRQIYPPPGFP